MDELQEEYREQLNAVLRSNSSVRVKKLLVENLVNSIKDVHNLSKDPDYGKCRGNYEVLSTSISECYNVNYQMEKDVEEL